MPLGLCGQELPADSYVCTSCGGGGGPPTSTPSPVTSPPTLCSAEGESCQGGNTCCPGFTCLSFGKGRNKFAFCSLYTGSQGNRNGPVASADNTDMKFLAFGDTPYDENFPYPFEGTDYECLRDVILPGVQSLSVNDIVDWIVHVGDIKKGQEDYANFCDDGVFTSRSNLFSAVEPDLDFLLLAGDNEFSSECTGWTAQVNDSDEIQTRWRNYFTTGDFAGLDKLSPRWGSPSFLRQTDYPENFFMYYAALNLAFFGITEPAGDNDYNLLNANFIQSQLSGLGSTPDAIIIMGHANLETSGSLDHVFDVLDGYSDIPMLYVMGNDHKYAMDFMAPQRLPKLLQLTVEAFKSAPLLVSIVNVDGAKFFHVEKTAYSC